MSNKHYIAGRAFEYTTKQWWEGKGYTVLRTAGSKGPYDLVAFRLDEQPNFIQCKLCATKSEAQRLERKFILETTSSKFFHQVLVTRVKRSNFVTRITI
jgi:hypothetical protein